MVDHIIVPSVHARFAFDNTFYSVKNSQSGEDVEFRNRTPIEIVPYPVKDITSEPIDLNLECEFNFLTVAQWGPRKNLDNTIRWFIKEFANDEVGLVVKANTRKNNVADRHHCVSRVRALLNETPDRKCRVYLLHGNMSEGEMSSLYQEPKIKCIVSATHGEGFGLPLFEAAYNALPVVAPNWSGHVDFLYAPKKDKKGKIKNKSHFSKVEYDLGRIQPEARWEGVLQADSQWCFPKENSFRRAMREVYGDYALRKSEAKKLSKHVNATFTAEEIYAQIASLVSGEEVTTVDMSEIPKISIITSVYNGDDYIEEFLEDITRQTIFQEKCELVMVNANSPGNEEGIIKKYVEKYPDNIIYCKLDEDPGIYGTWNHAIELSTGDFITNANLDDRKAINSLEKHAKELVLNPEVDLVYADSFITHRPNETFEKNSSGGKKYNFEPFSKESMIRGNQPHNNPMWRKTLHEKYGLFDSKYKSAGDWEFFLRSTFGGSKFKKMSAAYGLYYFNPKGISTNADNSSWKREEEREIFKKYFAKLKEEKKSTLSNPTKEMDIIL